MLTRKQKEEIVKNLAEEIKSAKAVVFSDFKGLEVKDMTSLKKELKKEGASFKVAKKNLINIALKNTGTDLDVKKMEGQIAVSVSSEDETAAAKIISKFSKKNENLKILGGLLGVKEMSVEEIKALAKLPSKEELLAKLVGGLSSPLSGFMNVLRGNQRSLVQALKAIGEKKA
ncbi:50S ribosomal protein L10 [bacterium]|nr:50S ribosomal protein L10 [bacterium]